ncbi:MAG: restriction endonuclease subunit S [Candidatus Methanoperedens sp.]
MKRELPGGWRWSTLGKECEINPRRTKDLGGNDNQETSFVPMEAVDGDKGIISEIRIVPFSKVKKGYTYFEENDVLFAKITPCMQNKKSAIANGLINGFGFGTTEFHVIRCKKKIIPKWIYYFIRNQRFIDGAVKNFTGAVGQQRVPAQFIEKFQIPVPLISEQRKIVYKIDRQMAQIEMMKKETDEQRAALDLLFESIINKEIQVLKSILVDKYNLVKLEDICDMRTGGTPSKSQPEFFGGDIKWIVSGDVNKEFIYDVDGRITEAGYKNSNAKMLPKDSVLIALNGQGKTRGMAAILKTEACCNQSIIAFTPKNKEEFDHVFLFYYLKGSYQKLRNLTGDKERSGLSMSTLRPFQVIAPPIDIQRKVSDKLQRKYDEIRNISISFQKQKKSIDELPASILNEVFGLYHYQ